MCRFCSCRFHFVVIIHMHTVVSHSISIIVVIISLFRDNSVVSVIWVCFPCAVLLLLVKSHVLARHLNEFFLLLVLLSKKCHKFVLRTSISQHPWASNRSLTVSPLLFHSSYRPVLCHPIISLACLSFQKHSGLIICVTFAYTHSTKYTSDMTFYIE